MVFNCPTEDQIRQRAHEIFLQHGSQSGHDVDNWLQAEYELIQLPVRKIAELAPPEAKQCNASKSSLVNLVQTAVL